jgi:hypothetical protein
MVNERLAYAGKKLHLIYAQFSKRTCVTIGFLSSMEIDDRKVNSRIIKIINLADGISSKWLETGKGEMFADEPDREIEGTVNLYRQLNHFFKGYFKRQLLEIINYENGSRSSEAGA